MVRHVVIVAYVAWGHLRPESALAVTLVRKFEDAIISFVVDSDLAERSHAEMERQCLSPAERTALLPRIRLISTSRIYEGFSNARRLVSKVLLDSAFHDDTGKEWTSVGAQPKTVIGDVVMGNLLMTVREEHEFRLLLWWGGSASAFTRMYGPPEHGGRKGYAEECMRVFESEELRGGRSFQEVIRDVAVRSSHFPDDVVRLAGLPPYYQWEDWPQETWNPALYDALSKCQELAELADGFLLGTVEELEKASVADLQEYMQPKTVLCLGPQFLLAPESGEDDPAINFLNKASAEYGQHSALYVSFGSAFFPPPEHVHLLVETILSLDKPMPFVFTASRQHLQPQLLKKIEESGRGLVVPWAPQQAVLAHPAVGWMISHCGGGGVFESLAQGVPVIAWPFTADQPQHALWLSEVLDSAFELLQVRKGDAGERKAFRGSADGTMIRGTAEATREELAEVFKKLRGEDGERKRKNAKDAQEKIFSAVERGGSTDEALDKLNCVF